MRRTAVVIVTSCIALSLGCTERLLIPGATGTGSGGTDPAFGGSGGFGGIGGNGGSAGRGFGGAGGRISCNNPLGFSIQRADVMLSVGRDSSMSTKFGVTDQTRMAAVETVLKAFVMAYHNAVNFGYQEFPSPTSCANACCVDDMEFSPAPNTDAAIVMRLSQCDPFAAAGSSCVAGSDLRPIANALNSSLHIFTADPSGGDREVVLIVDGPASCSSDPAANQSCSNARDQAGQLSKNLVRTHVIAVGPEAAASSCLLTIAGQAGTGPSQEPGVYPADDMDQLTASLHQIITAAARSYCVINLDSMPQQPGNVTVFIPGQMIPFDPMRLEGWNYQQGQQNRVIEVHGAWCQTLQAVRRQDIDVCP